jgi:hypothetical protein
MMLRFNIPTDVQHEENVMTTVIGVFDTDSDLEVALNRLYDKGFNEVRVVDRAQQTEAEKSAVFVPGAAISNPAGSTPNGIFPGAFIVPGFVNVGDEALNSNYVTANLDIALTDEEADFYANTLRNGGKLLIVNTDDEHSDMVWSVMRNSNASQYTRPENA